jgi:hypothetical protein
MDTKSLPILSPLLAVRRTKTSQENAVKQVLICICAFPGTVFPAILHGHFLETIFFQGCIS